MRHQLRVLLGFTNAPDHALEETAGAVIKGMTGNAAYPSPPVTMLALQTALTAFTTAIAAQLQGGTAATAEKNSKRDDLVDLLRQLAGYVQQTCNNDLATLLTSGFEAVSSSNAQSELDDPVIASVDNGNTGHLPKNIRIRRLPDLAALRNYPTLGPSGLALMDVNGIAGSIELYLGADVLIDESGNLTPVQWTGYDSSLRKYQGELVTKAVVQERFLQRMNKCRLDATLVLTTDWTGIRAILNELFVAFRDLDRENIQSGMEQFVR